MTNYIYCCDWGTSSLRIRLISIQSQEIIDQETDKHGIADLYDEWVLVNTFDKDKRRVDFYLSKLEEHLRKIADRNDLTTDKIPVVISGMASSSIGIVDLPYAELPFTLEGHNAVVYHIDASPIFNHRVLLLSGVKDGDEVMRGEEVHLIGIAGVLSSLKAKDQITVLLPGTHSKHVSIRNGNIAGIETYITGELFAIVSKHGLLKEAVQSPENAVDGIDWDVFIDGVNYSGSTTLLQALFKVRTNQLFNRLSKQQNYSYLSGLLIGFELRSLLNKPNTQLVLCCGENLNEHYKKALTCLGLDKMTYFLNPFDVEKAIVKGQIILAHKYLNPIIR
ncbi:2-dehydro-3-deoxygalactonokinase [Aquiflexum sp.]|uniref:2-dehydro-3-deoxygalactonokinase n=1 Tax=Aquiflexum sp. TaxID=1872584 RepID=UPI00359308A3